MTRVAVREVIEAGTWALRAAGVSTGDAPLVARAAALAEVANGTGVAALCDALQRLDSVEGTSLGASVIGSTIECPVDIGALVRLPRATAAACTSAGTTMSLTNASWHHGGVGALIASFRTNRTAVTACGSDHDAQTGWAAVTADGVWYAPGQPPVSVSAEVDFDGRLVVASIGVNGAGAPMLTWAEFDARHLSALRNGLDTDDADWARLCSAAYRFLVPDR